MGAQTERYLKKNVPPPARVAYELIGHCQYRARGNEACQREAAAPWRRAATAVTPASMPWFDHAGDRVGSAAPSMGWQERVDTR